MTKRRINKVAILGSGIMGSRIACHFANIGVEVLLLDIIPTELTDKEKKLGLKIEDQVVRNRIVNDALSEAINSSPSPLYVKKYAERISCGNLEDDIQGISEVDWIIEAVIERLDIKNSVFELVEKHRTEGTIVSTNTSGIPINRIAENRSTDFKKHFIGTHFFNPPRYLELLELIPGKETDHRLIDFLLDYGQRFLGKKPILCKDTPAFIANRIGVFSIMSLFHQVQKSGLSIEEVDQLTGPILGRPKSATFRTCDVVGLDTLIHVADGVRENCPEDEQRKVFEAPDFIKKMLENKWLGAKTKKGFYEKKKTNQGSSVIQALNLKEYTYHEKKKVRFDSIAEAKKKSNLRERVQTLVNHPDKGGEFLREIFHELFAYVSFRIPEISEDLYQIDEGMKAGFGWQLGPFESWESLGIKETVSQMKENGKSVADWVHQMIDSGYESFYIVEDGISKYYDIQSNSYIDIPGKEKILSLANVKHQEAIWKNKGASIYDLGDGVINLEFHSKMNTIGLEIIQGINKAIDIAEQNYDALVIYNNGQNFSVGADVGMIFMMAVEQEYDELAYAISMFQKTMMRIRYSSIPVVVAIHQMTLGGGCELAMHADKVVAHAETYIGLVEFGVGVIPGGGGTKEFALRLSDEIKDGDIRTNAFRNRFLTIGQAKVATSAYEAFGLGYLRKGIDEVCVSRELQMTRAKKAALDLVEKGYTKPIKRKDITVLGAEALGLVYAGAHSMKSGNYISEHDQHISEKLGYVMAGGDLSEITKVSEDYLLKLEQKAFIELCMKRKTLERLQSMITKGKVLRN